MASEAAAWALSRFQLHEELQEDLRATSQSPLPDQAERIQRLLARRPLLAKRPGHEQPGRDLDFMLIVA